MVWSTGVERARVMQDDWRLLELPYVLVNTLTVPRQDPSGSLRKRMRNCRPGDQVVVYATSLGKQTAVPQLLQSVQMWRSGVKLALVGFGLEEFLNDMQQQIRDLAIQDRVEYLGAFAKQELFNSFSDVNLGVVLRNHRHAPDLNTVYITPSKLLEYAAYGIPVLCSDNPSLRFVEREGWGLCVDPDDPVALAGAVNALTLNPTALKRMGELARKRFVEEYCMEVQGQRLIEALQTRNLLPRLDRET
jgi:glycosyltransferase involved in cell wall biosynthesis